MKIRSPLLLAALSATVLSGGALAQQINTGGTSGAYHSAFCPPMVEALKNAYFNFSCAPSAGSGENIERLRASKGDISFVQGDVYALAATSDPTLLARTTVVRRDIANECIFAVTTNPAIRNIGDIAKAASRIPIVLPPKGSGSAATFELLQKIDPEGLGRAKTNVTYAPDAKGALTQALSSPGAVAFFVQLPDPSNPNFKLISDKKGRFVPVVDRNILRYEIGGQLVYLPETSSVTEGGWGRGGDEVTTACTPMLVTASNPEGFDAGSNARKDQEDLIAAVKGVDRDALLPTQGTFSWLKKKVRTATSDTVNQLIRIADEARR